MSILPKGQREQILVFVAFLSMVAAGGYWYFVYQKKAAALAEKSERLEKLAAVNEKARRELARGSVDQLRAQLAENRSNLELLRTLVPTNHEVPALLEQVSTAARREGLELAAVAPQPVVTGDHFDTYRYDIGVIGGYHALAAFLTNVGSLTRIIAPVNVKLIESPNANSPEAKRRRNNGSLSGALIEARFQIQTYVARQSPNADDGATPLPPAETGTKQ